MERSIQTKAVVTSSRPFGESNKSVNLLSPDLGLINVIIFGGRKGKKASSAPLFSFGTFQLYFNPVKNEYTFQEENSTFIPVEINKDIGCIYTASYLCEVINKIKTDDSRTSYDLLTKAIEKLETSPSKRRKVIVDFTYSILKISGLETDFENCPICNRLYSEKEELGFSTSMTVPCCQTCRDNSFIKLSPGCRRYLKYTSKMSFEEAFSVEVFPTAEEKIMTFLFSWLTQFIGYSLKTIQSGLL